MRADTLPSPGGRCPNKGKAQRTGFLRGAYCINFFRRPAWIGAV
ncbi:hypothetical protein NEIELOOT_01209 [Neisseria elongata subsp. glycolytica ATCC 29315]|uniref:Uncharacterized protein n=1 Tax=Neisseria elongata subsp. glycolytica ATCC 29315 TaxID=546263 RepID=D4DQ71_NEIEG|nr:hypothetical protein NEIELOOT_01209 [Neisseria elongata subsp. glycolytica ATCC 29315]